MQFSAQEFFPGARLARQENGYVGIGSELLHKVDDPFHRSTGKIQIAGTGHDVLSRRRGGFFGSIAVYA